MCVFEIKRYTHVQKQKILAVSSTEIKKCTRESLCVHVSLRGFAGFCPRARAYKSRASLLPGYFSQQFPPPSTTTRLYTPQSPSSRLRLRRPFLFLSSPLPVLSRPPLCTLVSVPNRPTHRPTCLKRPSPEWPASWPG